jgi:phosphinothricin acetyltransferase
VESHFEPEVIDVPVESHPGPREILVLMEIRPARRADLEALTDLYNHFIQSTTATFDVEPFTYAEREARWFRHYAPTGRHRLLVADNGGRVLGYASSSPFRPKAAYETSVETSIYVAPGQDGRGIGRALYSALFEALAGEDVHRAYALISLPNDASIALHAAFGFVHSGTLTQVGRKFDRFWDVAFYERAAVLA